MELVNENDSPTAQKEQIEQKKRKRRRCSTKHATKPRRESLEQITNDNPEQYPIQTIEVAPTPDRQSKFTSPSKRSRRESIRLNKLDESGKSQLFKAVKYNRVSVVKALLERNADPAISNFKSMFPIHIATKYGYVEVLKLLIDYHVDCSVFNYNNDTPLHICCDFNREDVLQLLLNTESALSTLTKRNKQGKTPLNICYQNMLLNEESSKLYRLIHNYYSKYINQNLIQSKPISLWTKEDVGDYLDYLELGKYRIEFIKNNIDGMKLENFDISSVGLLKSSNRRKLSNDVEKIIMEQQSRGILKDKKIAK